MSDTQTIIALEKKFWQALVDKDARLASSMIAEEFLVAGRSGSMKLDPAKYEALARDGQWLLATFDFSDVNVIFPAEDTAVIAYRVHQTGEMKGEPMDMHCADSSTWVNDGGKWKCALHTETVLEGA